MIEINIKTPFFLIFTQSFAGNLKRSKVIEEGKQLEGKIQIVIKSGQTVYKNGKLNTEKGSGKYLV